MGARLLGSAAAGRERAREMIYAGGTGRGAGGLGSLLVRRAFHVYLSKYV